MKNKHAIPIILLIVISAVIFSNTFKNPFMWDDRDLIVENKYIEDLEYIPFLFSTQYWNHYYP
ncbi:MAG: hypothetical protein KJ952_02635, partial [Candidatus Omnitrophica bacterium]|nr:hypothetical protein [Candidatus Omnitrophota bacterium]